MVLEKFQMIVTESEINGILDRIKNFYNMSDVKFILLNKNEKSIVSDYLDDCGDKIEYKEYLLSAFDRDNMMANFKIHFSFLLEQIDFIFNKKDIKSLTFLPKEYGLWQVTIEY